MMGPIRAVLVWLLVLALPAQGAAAATMALCNPDHHALASVPASRHAALDDHVQHHAHRHAQAQDAVPHTHNPLSQGGAAMGRAPVNAAHADSASDEAGSALDTPAMKLAQADDHRCSACASCCSAAMTGRAVPDVPAPGVAPAVFIAVVPTVQKFSSDGPDRPPRAHFV